MEKTEVSLSSVNLEVDEEVTKVYENQCLIGKILFPRSLDQTLVKSFTQANWKCKMGVTVTKISRKMFMFVFLDKQDLATVVKNSPWTIMGGLLILSPCSSGEVPHELNFSYSPFWVQAHGLPLNYLTAENGSKIGRFLGSFICSDWHVSCVKISCKNYLRLRVVLDVTKPILTGFWLNRPGLSRVWVDFKYENLGLFCYKCGRIGDSFRTCKFPSGQEKFGAWLRVDLRDYSDISHPISCRGRSRLLVDITPVDRKDCITTLLAVPKKPEPNRDDQSSSHGDTGSQNSTNFEQTPDETENSTSTSNVRRRVILSGIDSMIMLTNCTVGFWRTMEVDESEGNWRVFIFMAAYLLYLSPRALRPLLKPRKLTSDDDDVLGEILVSIVFLVLLVFF